MENEATSKNFIEQAIEKDLAEGVYDTCLLYTSAGSGSGSVTSRQAPAIRLSRRACTSASVSTVIPLSLIHIYLTLMQHFQCRKLQIPILYFHT